MNALALFLEQPWSQALAWTLIHFVWQGAAIAFATYLVLHSARLAASTRYLVGVAALAMMLVLPAATFVALSSADAPVVASLPAAAPTAVPAAPVSELPDAAMALAPAADGSALVLPMVVAVWFLGVVALSVRLLGGWVVARRIARRAIQPVSPEIRAVARRVAGRLALDRVVRLYESSAVAVPVTVGWIKPVVLIPVAALSGLSARQIEALLAHELAHVRRHDYLVNLLQSAVETLLFYHPAVWWVSKIVRVEREHCCDDLAVEVCDRLVYVSALTDLAALNSAPRLALAATDGPLVSRVRRLLGREAGDGETGSSWLPAVVVLALAVAAVPVVIAQGRVSSGQAAEEAARSAGVGVGVAGGVSGGVAQGVATGSNRGRAIGVAGGVDQGVARGTAVGIAGGVSGGVGTGIHVDRARGSVGAGTAVGVGQSTSAEQRAEEVQRARQIAEIERQRADVARRVRQQQAEVEQELLRLQMAQTRAKMEAQASSLEAQIQLARQNLADAARRADAGAIQSSQVAEFEMAVRQLEQERHQVQVQEQYEVQRLALRMREIDQQRQMNDQLIDLEYALEQARRDRNLEVEQRADVDARQRDVEAVIEEYRARLEAQNADELTAVDAQNLAVLRELAARSRTTVDALLARTSPVTGSDAQARENDVVVLEISGESMLPRTYPVGTDGNIRLPLLGNLQVRGLTTNQIRDLVSERLADRQLAQGATVTVELRRGGEARVIR